MQGLCTITARCHEQIVHIQHGSNKNSAKKQCGQNTQSPYIQLSTGRRLDESLCHNMPDIGWHRCTNGGVESKSQAIEYTDSPHKHVVPHQVWPSLPYPATAFGREKRHCQWPGYRSLCAGSKLFTMAQSRQQRGIVQTRGKTPATTAAHCGWANISRSDCSICPPQYGVCGWPASSVFSPSLAATTRSHSAITVGAFLRST